MGLEAGQAWLAALIVTGVANYFLLSKLLDGPTKDAAKEQRVTDARGEGGGDARGVGSLRQ